MKLAFVMIALTCGCAAQCWAASTPSVPPKLLACRQLRNPGERLRCYDTQIAALTRVPSAGPGPAASAPTAPPAPTSGPESASRRAAEAPVASSSAPTAISRPAAQSSATQQAAAQFGAESLPRAERPPAPRRPQSLRSTITAKHEVAPDLYLISLANGQVWRQDGSQVLLFFRVGDTVTIERHTTFDSYHMWDAAVGSKNWVRVTRVR